MVEKAKLLTSTPEKNAIEERSKATKAKVIKQTKTKSVKKLKFGKVSVSHPDDTPCIMCGDKFSNSASGEKWVRCGSCNEWAHVLCTEGNPVLVCPECLP